MDSSDDQQRKDDDGPLITCPNGGCGFTCTQEDEVTEHATVCEYRMASCGFCGANVRYQDMSAHRAVKRCYEVAQRRRLVQSARGVKSGLTSHRHEMTSQRHSSEQLERRITREFHERESMWNHKVPLSALARRRVRSAGALLIGNTAAQARITSARAPNYDSAGYFRLHSAAPNIYRYSIHGAGSFT